MSEARQGSKPTDSTVSTDARYRTARILLGVEELTPQQKRMIGQTGDLATLPFTVGTGSRIHDRPGTTRLGRDDTGALHRLVVDDDPQVIVAETGEVTHEVTLDENNTLPAWVQYTAAKRGWAPTAAALEVLK